MIKKSIKITLASVLVLCGISAFANSSNIENLVREKVGIESKVISSVSLKELQNMKLVILESNEQRVPFLSNENGNTLIGLDNSFLTSNDDMLAKLQKTVQEAETYNTRGKNDKLLANIKGKNYPVISLQSKHKTNKTIYIVSDPNCPYCQDELARIDERLENGNVKIIVVGLLSDNSLSKASDIYEQIKSAKTNQAKIDTLKRIYANGYKTNSTPNRIAIDLTNLIRQSGITGVPYLFETLESPNNTKSR